MREWLGGHLVTGQCEPTTGRYYYNVREKVVPLTSRPTNHGQVWESGATGGEEQLLPEPWIWIWMLGRAGDVRCCELWEEEGRHLTVAGLEETLPCSQYLFPSHLLGHSHCF